MVVFIFVLKKDWNQKCKESHWNWLNKSLKVAKEKGMGINFYFSGLIFEVVLHSEMPNNSICILITDFASYVFSGQNIYTYIIN